MQTRISILKLWLIFPFLVMLACGLPGLAQTPHPEPAATAGPSTPAATAATVPASSGLTPTRPTPTVPRTIAATFSTRITQATVPATAGPASILLAFNSSQKPPAGILAQIGNLQSGGGGDGSGSECENRSGEIRWCNPLKGGSLPRTATYLGIACGFNSQALTASIVLPDGRMQTADVQGEPPHCRDLSFTPGPDAPLGRYQVTLSQGNTRLSDTFILSTPTKPAGALYYNCAWLAGLPLGQPLRLLSFGLVPPNSTDGGIDPAVVTWKFTGERPLTPGPTATLLACPDPSALERYPELAYLAYPAGGSPLLLGDPDILSQFQGICAGGPPARLGMGKTARVTVKEMPMFSDPALITNLVAMLSRGQAVTVVNGPVCPPEGPWTWQVRTASGTAGWLAESDTSTYFLEPTP